MKEKQMLDSMKLLDTLRRREIENRLEEEEIILRQKEQNRKESESKGLLYDNFALAGLPLQTSPSVNYLNQGNSGKKYAKVKYTAEEFGREKSKTPSKYYNTGKTNRSPSPYAPRTTASRKPFKYID